MVEHPTQGNWNPAEKNVYFLAGGQTSVQVMCEMVEANPPPIPLHMLVATNDFSPASNEDMALLERCFANGIRVLLDSGIFWLTNRHKKLHHMTMDDALRLHPSEVQDFDWLWERYTQLGVRYKDELWGIIELDQGGAPRKRETRAKLHDLGIDPIPVYHPLIDGWDYFDELADQYDRICFGNVVQANAATRQRLLVTAYERTRDRPDLWIHLLGYSANEWLHACPVESCDSSSWLTIIRWAASAREKGMLKTFSDFPMGFRYDYETDVHGPGGHRHSMAWAGSMWYMNALGWTDHLVRLEGHLDAAIR